MNDRMTWLREVADGNISLLPTVEGAPIVLRKGERCVLSLPNVQLYEDRMVSEYVGGSRGVSFRVAKGVSFKVGNFAGRSESHPELRLIDAGDLFLTTKRFIYSGSRANVDVPLTKLVTVEQYTDGIKIARSGKQRKELYVGFDGPYAYAAIAGAINASSQ